MTRQYLPRVNWKPPQRSPASQIAATLKYHPLWGRSLLSQLLENLHTAFFFLVGRVFFPAVGAVKSFPVLGGWACLGLEMGGAPVSVPLHTADTFLCRRANIIPLLLLRPSQASLHASFWFVTVLNAQTVFCVLMLHIVWIRLYIMH